MDKLKKILQYKKTISVIMIFILVIMLIESMYGATYNISDIPPSVRKFLEVNDFFNMIARPVGGFIHSVLSMLLNYVEDGFLMLASFDIFSLEPIQKFDMSMKNILYALIPIALIVSVIIRIFKVDNVGKTLMNAFFSMIMISLFVSMMGLGFELKNALIKDIDIAVGKKENEHISDTILKENTVDLKQSIKDHRVVYLSDQKDIDVENIDLNKKMDRDYLKTRYTYDDGKLTTEELDDGTFGFGKEFYYQYKTDYFALNIIEICSLIVYVLAIYKLAYMSGEWLKIKVTGSYFMLKGFHNLDNNGKIYGAGFKNLLAIVLLYFGMTFYTIISTALMKTEMLDNWLLKAIVIFAFGMSLVVGSGFFNEVLGIDDGSGFMMKSMFAGGRLARMGKSMARSGSNALGAIGGGLDKVSELGSDISNSVSNSLARNNERKMLDDMNDWNDQREELKGIEDKNIIYGENNYNPLDDDKMHEFNGSDEERQHMRDTMNELNGTNFSVDGKDNQQVLNDKVVNNEDSNIDEELQRKLTRLRGTPTNNNQNFKNFDDFGTDVRQGLEQDGIHLNNGSLANMYSEYKQGKSISDIKKDYSSMTSDENKNDNKSNQKDINNLNDVKHFNNDSRKSGQNERFEDKTFSNINNSTIGNNNKMNGLNNMKNIKFQEESENDSGNYEDFDNVIVGNNNEINGKKFGGKK